MAFTNAATDAAATQVKKFDGATGSGGVVLNDNFDALNSRTLDAAAALLLKAPLASPTFTGTVIAPAINGGSAANDDLTLQGTSNATRTTSYVLVQPNGGLVGIGGSTPTVKLHLFAGEMVLSDGAVSGTVGNGNISITGTTGSLNVYKRGVTNLASSTAGDRWAFYADATGFHFYTGTTGDTNVIGTDGTWLLGQGTPSSGCKLDVAGNIYPHTDNSYYIGKNSSSSPLAYKGLILKDQSNGNYYRIEMVAGVITATAL